MANFYTVISYDFFYQNNQPDFYAVHTTIMADGAVAFNDTTMTSSRVDFEMALAKVKAERFVANHEWRSSLDADVFSTTYTKVFESE